MSNYLGIDVGTSGSKALLMSASGKILAVATATHRIYSPYPGWSEQNPEEWWFSAAKATRAAISKAILPDQAPSVRKRRSWHMASFSSGLECSTIYYACGNSDYVR